MNPSMYRGSFCYLVHTHSHARIVPMLLRLVPRLQTAFPKVKIKLRGDAGFALPLLYEFCEFFDIEYALRRP